MLSLFLGLIFAFIWWLALLVICGGLLFGTIHLVCKLIQKI